MTDILLTGFMGTGKTSAGRVLAQRYGYRFVDTDVEVERRAGKSIAEIFHDEGEAAFRALEHSVLQDLSSGTGRVIALGGGALMSEENRRLVHPGQTVLCLSCDQEELLRRIGSCQERPLVSGSSPESIVALLERRREQYALYPQIDTTGRCPSEVADEIVQSLGLHLSGELTFLLSQSSQIYFREGLLDALGPTLRDAELGDPVLLVTDSNVARTGLVEQATRSLTRSGLSTVAATVPAGEEQKTLASLERLYRECMTAHLDRGSTVVALGGGMIGDLAGMLAATYLRGIELVQVPTTLLAQVDASIGGKVGVDLDSAKNLVGAFYPARLVLVDPMTLRTLPTATLRAGMAEIVKIALMRSAELLAWLDDLANADDVLNHPEVIRRAAEEKVKIAQSDPYERGDRMLLNFGHTIGHGVEAASSYRLSHGEAISVGMMAELTVAVQQGWSGQEVLGCLEQKLSRFGLPLAWAQGERDRVLDFTRHDKKRRGGTQRFAVPVQQGRGAVFDVPGDVLERAVDVALGGAL